MPDTPQNEYLKSKVMTASPEQLQMMLYDGAIRFAEQARQALQEQDVPAMHDRLLRAQRIVAELLSNLKADVYPELCGKLASLYTYVYGRLIDANLKKDISALDEALELLRYQRDTWQLLVEKLREMKAEKPSADEAASEEAAEEPAGAANRPAGRPRPLPVHAASGAGQKGLQGLIGGKLSLEG